MPSTDLPPVPATRSWRRVALGVLCFVVVVVVAFHTIDRAQFMQALSKLRPGHVAILPCVCALHIGGRALRYHWLVRAANPNAEYRLRDGVRIFLIGLSASAVTPAKAGDFVKGTLIARYGIDRSVGFGLVLVERTLDLLVIAGFIVVSGVLLSGNAASDAWQASALTFAAALVFGVVVLSQKTLRERLFGVLLSLLRTLVKRPGLVENLQTKLDGLFSVWDLLFTSPVRVAGTLIASSVVWALDFTKLWLVLRFLQSPSPLVVVYFVYPVSIVAGIISLIPFSEGVVGITGVALLGTLAGVDSGVATLGITVDRTTSVLLPIALWAFFTLWQRRRPG